MNIFQELKKIFEMEMKFTICKNENKTISISASPSIETKKKLQIIFFISILVTLVGSLSKKILQEKN